jgi:hypothetical protein
MAASTTYSIATVNRRQGHKMMVSTNGDSPFETILNFNTLERFVVARESCDYAGAARTDYTLGAPLLNTRHVDTE